MIKIIATGFGIGTSPVMPGTLGSLLGIPLFLSFKDLPWHLYFLTILAFTVLTVWMIDRALSHFEEEDPRPIVMDEVAGYLWAAGFLQFLGFWNPEQELLSFLVISFGLFRFWDISKIWPVGLVERHFQKGWGVVLDDVAAGILAGIFGVVFCILYPFFVHLFVS